ncbi:uncharacterized protein LOC112571666 isoform X2 [Pomacea canaliculata]|uniref:uncharacterized protein LOC112571666 isoform X2 n=1 Tax=Pomacea canaliculata TaxID=400727 RepID=UPI000D72929C|nr:uncharacterized protein LOC112571666 isoform X2 [Pomacea canaliculata]
MCTKIYARRAVQAASTAKYDSCPPSPLSVNTSAGLVPGTIGLLSPPLSVAVHSMPDASPTFRSSSLRRDSELTVWAELLSPTCASRRQPSSSQGIETGEHVAVPTLALNLHKLHRSLSTDLSAREQPLSPSFMLSGYDEGFLTSIPPAACVDYNRLKEAFATQRQIQDGIIGNSSPASSRLEHPKCFGMLSASPLSISRDSHRDLEQDDTITSSTSHDQQGMAPPKTRTFSTTAPASPAPSPEKSVDSDTIDMVSRGPSLLTSTLYTKESFAKAKSIYALPPDIPEYKPTPVAPLYEPSPKRPKLEESPFPSPLQDRIPSRRLSASSDKLLTLKSPSYHPASFSFSRSVRDLPLPVSPADSSTDKLRPTGSSSADIDTADDMKNFLNSVLERKPSIRPPLPPKRSEAAKSILLSK